jgi:hypothetical protein
VDHKKAFLQIGNFLGASYFWGCQISAFSSPSKNLTKFPSNLAPQKSSKSFEKKSTRTLLSHFQSSFQEVLPFKAHYYVGFPTQVLREHNTLNRILEI